MFKGLSSGSTCVETFLDATMGCNETCCGVGEVCLTCGDDVRIGCVNSVLGCLNKRTYLADDDAFSAKEGLCQEMSDTVDHGSEVILHMAIVLVSFASGDASQLQIVPLLQSS